MNPREATGVHLVALRLTDPDAWARRVRGVYVRTKSVEATAKELEVGERTIWRWIKNHPELKEGR